MAVALVVAVAEAEHPVVLPQTDELSVDNVVVVSEIGPVGVLLHDPPGDPALAQVEASLDAVEQDSIMGESQNRSRGLPPVRKAGRGGQEPIGLP